MMEDPVERTRFAFEPSRPRVLCVDDAGRALPHVESSDPHAAHERAAVRLWGVDGRGLPLEWIEGAIGAQQAALEAAPYEDKELLDEMRSHHNAAINEIRALSDVLDALDTAGGGRAPRTQPLPGLELAPIEGRADRPPSPRRAAAYDRARAQLVRVRMLAHLDAKVAELAACAARLHRVAAMLDAHAGTEDERTQLSAQMRRLWAPADLRGYDDAALLVGCGEEAERLRVLPRAFALPADIILAPPDVKAGEGDGEGDDGAQAARMAARGTAYVQLALLRSWAARHHRRAFAQLRDELLGAPRAAGSGAADGGCGRSGHVVLHWAQTHVAFAPSIAASAESASSQLLVALLPAERPMAPPQRLLSEAEDAVEPAQKRARAVIAGSSPSATAAAARAATLSALVGALAMLPAGRVPSEDTQLDDVGHAPHLVFGRPRWEEAKVLPGQRSTGRLLLHALNRASAQLQAVPTLLRVLRKLPRLYGSPSVPVSVRTRPLPTLESAHTHAGEQKPDWPQLGGALGFEIWVGGEISLDGALASGGVTLRTAGAFSMAAGPLGGWMRKWDELSGIDESLSPTLELLVDTVAMLVCKARLARARQIAHGLGLKSGLENCGGIESGGGASFVAGVGGTSDLQVRVRQPSPAPARLPAGGGDGGAAWLPTLSPLTVETAGPRADAHALADAQLGERPGERDADGLGRVCAALLVCRAAGV